MRENFINCGLVYAFVMKRVKNEANFMGNIVQFYKVTVMMMMMMLMVVLVMVVVAGNNVKNIKVIMLRSHYYC